MTCGPLAQAGDCLTLEPWGGGASPPEPHKGVRGTGWGALGRRTSPSPPHMPTRLVKQRRASPQLCRQNPRHLLSAQLAHSAASASGRRRSGSVVRVCVCGHMRVCGHMCVFSFRSSCITGYCKTPSVAPCAGPVGPCRLPNVHVALCMF